MRTLPSTVWIVLFMVCSLGVRADEEPARTADAVVAELSGSVEIQLLDQEEWKPAEAGSELMAGDTIRTGKKGRALVRLGEDIEIRLGSETTVEIQLPEETDVRRRSVALMVGLLFAKVTSPSGDETSFEVQTPNAVAGVRGTEFATAVALDGALLTSVSEGKVVVENESGSVDLLKDQFTLADSEAKPSAPASDPAASVEEWLAKRRKKIVQKAPELTQRWIKQAKHLKNRLAKMTARAEKLGEELEQLGKRAASARRAGQRKVLRRIQVRMVKLIREAVLIRRNVQRKAVRLRSRMLLLGRLADAVAEEGNLPPEAMEKIKQWRTKAQDMRPMLRKLRRERIRHLKKQAKRERGLIRAMKMKYRDFLKQRRRKGAPPPRLPLR